MCLVNKSLFKFNTYVVVIIFNRYNFGSTVLFQYFKSNFIFGCKIAIFQYIVKIVSVNAYQLIPTSIPASSAIEYGSIYLIVVLTFLIFLSPHYYPICIITQTQKKIKAFGKNKDNQCNQRLSYLMFIHKLSILFCQYHTQNYQTTADILHQSHCFAQEYRTEYY